MDSTVAWIFGLLTVLVLVFLLGHFADERNH